MSLMASTVWSWLTDRQAVEKHIQYLEVGNPSIIFIIIRITIRYTMNVVLSPDVSVIFFSTYKIILIKLSLE